MLTDEPPEPATTPRDHDLALTLTALLDDLPEKQRAVLVLRFWEDLTVPQISECTGVAEGTIFRVFATKEALEREAAAAFGFGFAQGFQDQ